MNNELTPRQWQLLSAYLDDQLKDKEKRQIEELLQQNPAAKEALGALQRTRTLLRAMPMRKAPRNFTISAESVKKPILPTFTAVLRFSSAMAALLLVAVLALDFLGLAAPAASTRMMEDAAAPEMLAMEAPAEGEDEQPPIIFWGGPPPMGAYGKGGGDGSGYPIGGGAEGPALGIGGGGGDPYANIPPVLPLPEAIPQEEALPPLEEPMFPAEPTPLEEGESILPTPEESLAPQPLSGSGPILGVRPPEEQGELRVPAGTEMPDRGAGLPVSLQTIEIILAVLLVVMAIPAWLLRKK